MKRREFLKVTTATGLATAVVPSFVRAAHLCPPPTYKVAVPTITTPCGAPKGAAPNWFVNAPYNTWNQIAGDSTANLGQALAKPLPQNGGYCYASAVVDAWSGGAVDQSRNEYLLCANGGHSDGADNSCYALAMSDAVPRWRRLSDPTPNSSIDYSVTTGPNGYVYLDGRPRAMHSTFETFGDGRVWFAEENSSYNPAGNGADQILSFDRNFPALIAADQNKTPLAWTNDLGPWTLHGKLAKGSQSTDHNGFGVAVFDRVDHKVWGLGGNGANYTPYWSIDTTGNVGQNTFYFGNKPFGNFGGWAVVAHDLRILIAGCNATNTICILDLKNPTATTAWTQAISSTGPAYFKGGSGGVYVQGNHSILIGNPKDTGATIYKLQIPVSGSSYTPSGQWVWSTITPTGQGPNTFDNAGGNNDAYSKWNIIEDMGNGESALVFVGSISMPVYWVRIPSTGI